MNALATGSCTLNEIDAGTCDLAAIGWPGALICIVFVVAVAAVAVAFIIGASKE
jgi:hypothetical protein